MRREEGFSAAVKLPGDGWHLMGSGVDSDLVDTMTGTHGFRWSSFKSLPSGVGCKPPLPMACASQLAVMDSDSEKLRVWDHVWLLGTGQL